MLSSPQLYDPPRTNYPYILPRPTESFVALSRSLPSLCLIDAAPQKRDLAKTFFPRRRSSLSPVRPRPRQTMYIHRGAGAAGKQARGRSIEASKRGARRQRSTSPPSSKENKFTAVAAITACIAGGTPHQENTETERDEPGPTRSDEDHRHGGKGNNASVHHGHAHETRHPSVLHGWIPDARKINNERELFPLTYLPTTSRFLPPSPPPRETINSVVSTRVTLVSASKVERGQGTTNIHNEQREALESKEADRGSVPMDCTHVGTASQCWQAFLRTATCMFSKIAIFECRKPDFVHWDGKTFLGGKGWLQATEIYFL